MGARYSLAFAGREVMCGIFSAVHASRATAAKTAPRLAVKYLAMVKTVNFTTVAVRRLSQVYDWGQDFSRI